MGFLVKSLCLGPFLALKNNPVKSGGELFKIDAEYDRAKAPPYNGNDPRPPPGSLKALSASTPTKQSTKQGDARGASEVRLGTSSNHSFPLSGAPVVQSDRSPKFRPAGTSGQISGQISAKFSAESVSTGVWRVPGFGTGFEIALEPSKPQKEGENPGKGHFYFPNSGMHQTLVQR